MMKPRRPFSLRHLKPNGGIKPGVAIPVTLVAICLFGGLLLVNHWRTHGNAASDDPLQFDSRPSVPVPREKPDHSIGNAAPPSPLQNIIPDWFQETRDVRRTERILLLGFDEADSRLPGRTDAIMVVEVRHGTGDIGIISIPRDLWVNIPDYEPGRINKVYRVGTRLHGKGGGQKLLKQVLETELGLQIDYTAAVDFSGFSQIVDAVEGIDVEVECPIQDNFISPTAESGYEPLFIEAGTQRMNGRQALLFSRSRHGRTDLDRARRQQAILLGLKNRMLDGDVFFRIPQLWHSLKDHVKTDMSAQVLLRLAKMAYRFQTEQLHGLVLKAPAVYRWTTDDGKSVLKLNRDKYDKARSRLYKSPSPGVLARAQCRPTDAALHWKTQKKPTANHKTN